MFNRPNVIWVFGDQHRRQLLGCEGDPNVRTPNIDNLAEYGIRFARGYSNFPLCCPARGTLLTGLHGHACIPGHNYRLPGDQMTIAHLLQEAGYRTAWFGKWHVDGPITSKAGAEPVQEHRPFHPEAPEDELQRECHLHKPREARGGFETWLGYENNNSPHNTWVHGHDETGKEIPLHRLDGFETDALTDQLIAYLEKRIEKGRNGQTDDPFFAALSVQPPHDPYGAPAEFMQPYTPASMKLRGNVPKVNWIEERARREYAGACAMVENLDWNLGRLREALRRLGLDTHTHIIFFSDHGDMHGSHGQFHKTNPYEESVGVPMIFGGGLDVQGAPIRKILDIPISVVDLPPTTLGLCGVDAPEWMHGTDFSDFKRWPPERGEEGVYPDATLLQLVIPTGHADSTDRAWRGVVTQDGWKYVCFENTDWLMFDHESDPLEMANLAHNTRFKDQRDRLRQRLCDLLDEVGDTFPVPGH